MRLFPLLPISAALLITVGCSYVYDVPVEVTLAGGLADSDSALMIGGDGQEVLIERDTEGLTTFTYTFSLCCAPDPEAQFYAYLDENNSGTYEAPEPRVASEVLIVDSDTEVSLTLSPSAVP